MELENRFAFPSHFRFNLPVQSHHTYQSALGWFGLGSYTEAWNELENLPPEYRASVEAMELRCRIYRKLEKWPEVEVLAEGCVASVKDVTRIPFACHHAWAILKQGRPHEARDALDKVPYTCAPELLFTGACLLCALNEMELARSLISDAITFSIDSDAMKLRALDEPELEPIWRHESDGQT